MKPLAILALLTLAACDQLPLGLLPTPAQICGLPEFAQAAIAAQLQTDLASLTAACEIVN
jgi:hypothetical protein